MIRTEGLSKTFKSGKKNEEIHAVEQLGLDIKQGEVFGFLGPNGAGKTTTVRMLCSLIAPTGGRAWVNNFEVGKQDREIRASVGILTEQPGMYDRLSAEKNLIVYAKLYGVADVPGQVEKYLRLLGLWERRKDLAGSFSKGMKQKLAIASALLHEPRILYLDEPTSGLDPESAHLVRDFIEELRKEGIRVIAILPGSTDTPIWETLWPDAPRKKMMRPESIAQAIVATLRLPPESTVEELDLMPTGGPL